MKCASCKFFDSAKVELGGHADGYCRLNPPQVSGHLMKGSLGEMTPVFVCNWPVVANAEKDYCHQHQEKMTLVL